MHTDALRSLVHGVVCQVCIPRRGGGLAMTEESTDEVQRQPGARGTTPVRMAQIVKPHAVKFRKPANSVPWFGQVHERLSAIAARYHPGR